MMEYCTSTSYVYHTQPAASTVLMNNKHHSHMHKHHQHKRIHIFAQTFNYKIQIKENVYFSSGCVRTIYACVALIDFIQINACACSLA